MRTILTAAVVATLVSVVPAKADFERWSVETEDDPFSGGKKVSANYLSSIRSGVFVTCDTSETGLDVRAVTGFEYTSDFAGRSLTMRFAFDGANHLSFGGEILEGGANNALAYVWLEGENADKFALAFSQAKRQIAISDGVTDRPHLMSASGSTKSGQALLSCLKAQSR